MPRKTKKSPIFTKKALKLDTLIKNPMLFIAGAAVGIAYLTYQYYYYNGPLAPHSWKACFTPMQGCRQHIMAAISQARNTILVQAYSFTAKPIAYALIAAHRQGIKVSVILDHSNLNDQRSMLNLLISNGVPVYIDDSVSISHNKVVIVDEEIVVTGSYNFTNSAEFRNAENLLVIHDKKLASAYTSAWQHRRSASKPYIINSPTSSPKALN